MKMFCVTCGVVGPLGHKCATLICLACGLEHYVWDLKEHFHHGNFGLAEQRLLVDRRQGLQAEAPTDSKGVPL